MEMKYTTQLLMNKKRPKAKSPALQKLIDVFDLRVEKIGGVK